MMGEKSGTDRLLDEAIDLIIRMQDDPDNPVAQSMIKRWRARSTRHEQIWQKVSGAHGMSGQVLKQRDKAERKAKSRISRRKLVIGGLAGVGAIGAGSLSIPDALVWARADHITPKGEVRRVTLADGSLSTLGPESAIAVDYGERRRSVELLRGMAFFEVAADSGRPFVVKARELAATASGTAFDISDDAGFIAISVAEGAVETIEAIGRAQRLGAGEWLSFDARRNTFDRGRRDVTQVASWRDGLIIADEEAVGALVAKIGRWHPGRIVILDASISEQRVSGLFDLSDPQRALAAVVLPAGGRVRHVSSYLTVISPI